ncbi:helix-turn-helix domain-containing protein [Paractinoplanes ferrugineus]|uniref:Transcriptional regulator n=2 Tax=Paractinoplanes ferrugineus TaxID=113564 RepID=A0A919MF21_9ACTN|nr:transcriptional regulator [Actinoplanes ferrugineus]
MSVRARPPFGGLDASMEVISGKWKVLIRWALRDDPQRFGALKRQVPGVSEKVLARQLRELEQDRVVRREAYDDRTGLRVEYSLTPRGIDLYQALKPLGDWGRRHLAPDAAPDRG